MEKNTGLKRIFKAIQYSWQGLQHAYRYEAAFRQEVILLLVAVPLACWVAETSLERLLLIGVVGFVLIVELINSAIEAVVDRIGSEHHELAGRAKDLGSAAVLSSLVLAGYVWLEVLLC